MTTIAPLACPTVVGITVTIEPTFEHPGDVRVHLAGELDGWSTPTLTCALMRLRPPVAVLGQRPAELVLDLHELSFLDSGGLHALEESRSALLAAGWIVKVGPAQPQVCRLLRFAARSGWLTDGPLAANESSASHLHVMPTAAEQRRRPRSITSVRAC